MTRYLAYRIARFPALTRQDVWLAGALVISLAVLLAAEVMELGFHLVPCELCLTQRAVYWGAASFAATGLVVSRLPRGPISSRLICWGLAAIFFAQTGLSTYHAGVEWKWWPGPSSCTGGGTAHITAADIAAYFSQRHHVVRCDEADWRFLGLSLAGWNVPLSGGLAIASGLAAQMGSAIQIWPGQRQV